MKYILCILLSIILYSCGLGDRNELEQLVEQNTTDSSKLDKYLIENLRIDYAQIIEPEGKKNTVIPIILEERYYEKGLSSYDYSNIIFYNAEAQTQKLLFRDSVDVISKINYFKKPKKEGQENDEYGENTALIGTYAPAVYDYLFFEISPWKTKKELKEEQKESGSYKKMRQTWQHQSEIGLFISNFSGDSLIRLTPPNTRVASWKILKNSSIILAKVSYDTNNDKLFNDKDEMRLVRIDLASPSIGEPILSPAEENLIKTNLLKGKTGVGN